MRKILEGIAKEAGKIILEIYNSKFSVEHKTDASPLTEADSKANSYILSELKKHYPQTHIISEEIENLSYDERKDWKEFFIVDPLDGTKEFVKKTGEFTVNIAYLSETKRVSVVYVPVTQVMYSTDGEKSYKNNKEIRVKEESEKLTVVASISHFSEETKQFIEKLGKPYELKQYGSSLKICAVAEGEADIYPRLAPTMEWDTAAAQLILETAGGTLIDAKTEKPLTYNKPNLLNPHFIALSQENILL
jgi:3'(2'), 5'-bisphosphate nucleotidase